MARKIVLIAAGLTVVLLCGRAPAKKGREVSRLAR